MPTKVAVIQKPPVLLDRDKTIARALASIDEAAREGATLLIFPEAYIPGYPTWIWRLKPGGDMALSNEITQGCAKTRSISAARVRGPCRKLPPNMA